MKEQLRESEKHMFTSVLKDDKTVYTSYSYRSTYLEGRLVPEYTQVITVTMSLVLSVYLYSCKNPDIGLPTVPHSWRLALFLCFLIISSCPIQLETIQKLKANEAMVGCNVLCLSFHMLQITKQKLSLIQQKRNQAFTQILNQFKISC